LAASAEDDDLARKGAVSVLARIARGVGVTPLGLDKTPVYSALYESVKLQSFGRVGALRCPHYVEDAGACGVWRHRNAVCATWFCKHQSGGDGAKQWAEVRDLLKVLERDLAIWAAIELGINGRRLSDAIDLAREPQADALTRELTAWDSASLWGPWADRKCEFFVRASTLVSGLDVSAALARSGPESRARVAAIRDRFGRRSGCSSNPSRVRVAAGYRCLPGHAGKAWLAGYSPYDWLEVPAALWDAMQRLVADDRASTEGGVPTDEIAKPLLDILLQWGVVTPVAQGVPVESGPVRDGE